MIDSLLSRLQSATDSVRQELAALLNPWRPIETAPKDGTFVLLFCGDGEAWCPTIGRWNGDGWGDEMNTFHLPGLNMPTHWLPLPAPPKEDKA